MEERSLIYLPERGTFYKHGVLIQINMVYAT